MLRRLEADLLRGNPKPFFGYGDPTHLRLLLWNRGLVSYHGGSVMARLARAGGIHPYTRDALQRALFTHGTHPLTEPGECTNAERSWTEVASADRLPPMRPAEPWTWHGPRAALTGPVRGGSLGIVDVHLRATRYLKDTSAYAGCVLFLETSEEMRRQRT